MNPSFFGRRVTLLFLKIFFNNISKQILKKNERIFSFDRFETECEYLLSYFHLLFEARQHGPDVSVLFVGSYVCS